MVRYNSKFDDFIEWVKREMGMMGLTHEDVARHGCSRTLVTTTLGKKHNPGEKFFLAVAGALKVSLDEIYARAGITSTSISDAELDIIAKKVADLEPEERETAEQFIDFLKAQRKPKKKKAQDDQDLIDKVERLTIEQRRKLIEAGDTLATIRRIKKSDETQPDNQHPSPVVQSRLL